MGSNRVTRIRENSDQQLTDLLAILASINLEVPLANTLQSIVDSLINNTHCDAASIEFFDESDNTIVMQVFSGIEAPLPGDEYRIPAEHTLSLDVIRSGRPVIDLNSIERNDLFCEFWRERAFSSISCFPVNARNGATLTLALREIGEFEDESREWIEAVSILTGLCCQAHKNSEASVRTIEEQARDTRQRFAQEILAIRENLGEEVKEARDKATRDLQQALDRSVQVIKDTRKALEESRAKNGILTAQIEQLSSSSAWDPVTKLPDHALFLFMLTRELARARRRKEIVPVLCFELENVQGLLDSPQDAAKEVLKEAANRLSRTLREGDVGVREGMTRFVWCVPGMQRVEDVLVVSEKMLSILDLPFKIPGNELILKGRIGISIFPVDALEAENLVKAAMSAAAEIKPAAQNRFRFHHRELDEKITAQLAFRKQFREALARKDFMLHYQPIINLQSREVISGEALVRWKKGESKYIYPAEFFGYLEKIGLCASLDEWVFRNACQEKSVWDNEGLEKVRVSINLSEQYFWDISVDKVSGILRESGVHPEFLELEISEKVLAKNTEKAIGILGQLRNLGLRLCIDDFGTGGGSLSSLKNYPVQSIKIDESLVRGISSTSPDASAVASIINMAHSQGMQVTAEAIESPGELEFLRTLKCDNAQGKLYSRALPRALFRQFVQKLPATALQSSMAEQPKIAPSPGPIASSTALSKTITAAAKPVKTEVPSGEQYMITCVYCHTAFDLMKAEWCLCLTSEQTLVCDHCKKCFCKSPLEYRHDIWGAAPDGFWDRKKQFEASWQSPPPNTPLPLVTHPLVLVVDDERQILRIAHQVIREAGFSVILAQNGEEGLKLAKEYKPEIILSDALMPKLDGREMCRLLKQDPQMQNVRTVVMTTFSGAGKYKTTMKEYNFDEQIQKPVEAEKIRSILQKYFPH